MSDESQISEREREILRLVATGATNQQIALQLNISINTVKVHLRNIYSKIGVVSRPEATLYAVRTGLVSIETATAEAVQPAAASIAIDEDLIEEPEIPPGASSANSLLVPEPPLITAPSPSAPPAPVTSVLSRRRLLLGGGLVVLLVLLGIGLAFARPWRAQPAMPTPASTESALALPGPNERWRELAPMPGSRAGFALAPFSFDGRAYLYAIGGRQDNQVDDTVLRYDLSANVWVEFSAKPTPVSDVLAAVIGNRIFVPGGHMADGRISAVLEAYDPQRDRWQTLAPLPEPRSGYGLVAVEGKLYLFGGWDGSAFRAEVWQYSPDQDEWQPRTALPEPRGGSGTAMIGGQVYLIGGENADGPLTLNQRYNPAEDGIGNPYTIRAPLPEPRSRMGIAEASGLVFLFGGADQGPALVYDGALDVWRSLETPLSPQLRDLRAQASGNQLYLFGGRNGEQFSARSYVYQAIYQVVVPVELGN